MFKPINTEKYKEALEIMREESCGQPEAAERVGVKPCGFNRWLKKNTSEEEYLKLKENKICRPKCSKIKKNSDVYLKALEIMKKEKCCQARAAKKAGVKISTFTTWLNKNISKEEIEELKKNTIRIQDDFWKPNVTRAQTMEKFKERFKHKKYIYNVEILDWAIRNDIGIPVAEFKPIIRDMGKEFRQC